MKSINIIIFLIYALRLSAFAAAKPDVTLEKLYLDEQCIPHYVIANNGDAGLPGKAYTSLDVLLVINDFSGNIVDLTATNIDPQKMLLLPHSRIDVIIQKLPVEGTANYFINLNPGPPYNFEETNYSNNRFTKQITCTSIPQAGNPKLKIVDINVVPGCNLEIKLKNIGPGNLPNGAYLSQGNDARFVSISRADENAIYINKWLSAVDPDRELKNVNGELTFTVNMAQGNAGYGSPGNPLSSRDDIKVETHRLSSRNDPSDEKIKSLYCAPDLSLEITQSPQQPLVGEEVDFTAKIRNVGSKLAPATILNWRIGSTTNQPSYSIPTLEPGKSTQVVRAKTLADANSYILDARLDENNEIDEVRKDNNRVAYSFHALQPGKPDFEVVDIMTMSPLVAGQPIIVKARLKNSGTAVADLYYYMRVGGETEPQPIVAHDVRPGQIIGFSRTVKFSDPGNYGIRVVVDPLSHVLELNEGNNQLLKVIVIH